MVRFLDISFSLIGLILLSPVLILIYLIGLFDTGSPLFTQQRLGKNQKSFKLIKFRTMRIGTAQVGTHLADKADITKLGNFLRKTKLDELPQLINVIKNEMSLVGPRPGLPSQTELKKEREARGVFNYKPGITGLGQIFDIDMSTPKKLSKYDQLMLKNLNLQTFLYIILKTLKGKGINDKIKMEKCINK